MGPCRVKAGIDNMSVREYGHAPVKLFGKIVLGLDLGHRWLTNLKHTTQGGGEEGSVLYELSNL